MHHRAPVLAGRFYEADPARLRAQVEAWLRPGPAPFTPEMAEALRAAGVDPALLPPEDAVPSTPEAARMVLLPHAGHVYCAEVMGQTLARVRLPRRLILLCPSHTGAGAPLAVWPGGSWSTPLGDVPVDAELAAALCQAGASGSTGFFRPDCEAHRAEHSLEVILPLLQVHSPEARIVPVCVRCPTRDLEPAAAVLAACIRAAEAAGDKVALVVSSDMNHFADAHTGTGLDALALARLCALDPVGLCNTVIERRISMCGVLPATLALFAAARLGQGQPRLVGYTNSARASGDAARVVGYAGFYLTL